MIGAPCFDVVNQRYFVVVSTTSDDNRILVANLQTKKVEQFVMLHNDSPDHLQYDVKNNRLLVDVNHTIHAVDLKTQKLTPLAKLPGGITALFGTTFDFVNQIYYAHLTMPLEKGTEYRWAFAELKNGKSGYTVIYDDLTNVHFIPAKQQLPQ